MRLERLIQIHLNFSLFANLFFEKSKIKPMFGLGTCCVVLQFGRHFKEKFILVQYILTINIYILENKHNTHHFGLWQ